MKIPNNLTDEDFIKLSKPESHYSNSNEMLGVLSSLTNRLHASLHSGSNQITSEVLGVLSEMNAMTITASRGYMHNSKDCRLGVVVNKPFGKGKILPRIQYLED